MFELQGEEQQDAFTTELSSIDVVTHEDVVRVPWLATSVQNRRQIVELPVDVADDGGRGTDLDEIRFGSKDFSSHLDDAKRALGVETTLVLEMLKETRVGRETRRLVEDVRFSKNASLWVGNVVQETILGRRRHFVVSLFCKWM